MRRVAIAAHCGPLGAEWRFEQSENRSAFQLLAAGACRCEKVVNPPTKSVPEVRPFSQLLLASSAGQLGSATRESAAITGVAAMKWAQIDLSPQIGPAKQQLSIVAALCRRFGRRQSTGWLDKLAEYRQAFVRESGRVCSRNYTAAPAISRSLVSGRSERPANKCAPLFLAGSKTCPLSVGKDSDGERPI